MKKSLLFIPLFAFATILHAQVTVKFTVDITAYLNGGGTISSNGVHIAGNFGDRGGNLPTWTPSAGQMTDEGDNQWTRIVNFDGTATDSLLWKYVKGNDWGAGDEGADWGAFANVSCMKPSDFNNRKALLPSVGEVEITSEWARCHTVTVSNKVKIQGIRVSMGPNPTNSTLNLSFWGNANAQVKVVGLNGKTVHTYNVKEAGETNHSIDVSSLANGLYYVTVIDGNKFYKAPFIVSK
jgi:hypothetical protein